jgi:guanylate kinase
MSALAPRLLVLSAPSGAGKTTLAKKLLSELPHARLSISTTTRPPRGQETEGREYDFVSESHFRELIAAGEFLEWAEVHSHLYGTRKNALQGSTAGMWTLFDVDLNGGAALKAKFPGAVTVLILPPSLEVLEARLRGRRTESEEAIQRRLDVSCNEIARGLKLYDYAVVNRELDQAVADVLAVLRAERLRLADQRPELEKAFGIRALSGSFRALGATVETLEKKEG